MYKKGMVEYNEVSVDGDSGRWDDTELRPAFFLPHSCDAWVIGDAAEARQLISDLQDLLVEDVDGG